MKMRLINFWVCIVLLFSTSLSAQNGIVFTDGSSVEDYGTKTFTETVSVNENFNRLVIHVDIQHSWVNDLELNIINPSGEKVLVFSRLGDDSCFGCDGSDINLTFSDDAETTYDLLNQSCDTIPAYSGNTQAISVLDDLLNTDPNGEWTIELKDYWPHEIGYINMIWMELTNYSAPDCTQLIYPENETENVPVNTIIEWIPAPLAEGYLLYLETAQGSNVVLDNIDVGNVSTFQLSGLECNTEYSILLTPYNQYGTAACIEQTFKTEFITAEIQETYQICKGDTIELEASGGDFYKWFPDDDLDDPDISNPYFFGDGTTILTVVVSNENGCMDSVQTHVIVNEIGFSIDTVDDVRLNSLGFIDISLDGAEGQFLFNWNGPNGFNSNEEDIDSLQIGCYSLSVTDIITGCGLDTLICVDDLTKVAFNSLNEGISLYPNPIKNLINIDLGSSFPELLEVSYINSEGKSIFLGIMEKGITRQSFALPGLEPGYYVIKLQPQKKKFSITIPFIKN